MIEENTEFQIYLKSRQGLSIDGSPNNIEFNFTNRPVFVNDEQQISLNVQFATIKVTWYNINSYNNLIYTSLGTFTIPVGNYNVYTLATELNTLMSGSGFTVTYLDTDSFFHFLNTVNFIIYNTTTADELLGLDFSTVTQISSTTYTITSTLIADLTYTSTIYVTSPQLQNLSRDSYSLNAISDVLAAIPVTVNSLGLIYYNATYRTTILRPIIDRFNIILKDENNQILQMNGGWWTLTLDIKIIANNFIKNSLEILKQKEFI